jgi:hypothetical protein
MRQRSGVKFSSEPLATLKNPNFLYFIMVGEEFIFAIPRELFGKISWVLVVIQAVGWAIIVYVIFSIITAILNKKRNLVVEQINSNLIEIKELLKKNS